MIGVCYLKKASLSRWHMNRERPRKVKKVEERRQVTGGKGILERRNKKTLPYWFIAFT